MVVEAGRQRPRKRRDREVGFTQRNPILVAKLFTTMPAQAQHQANFVERRNHIGARVGEGFPVTSLERTPPPLGRGQEVVRRMEKTKRAGRVRTREKR